MRPDAYTFSMETPSLAELLSGCQAFITYEPLRTEVPWERVVALPENTREHRIPPRASLDPATEARAARKFADGEDTALFIPGRRFDATGTRFGQGGGWYDRFLSAAPKEWLRIGFCYDDQFSAHPLVRQAHDQPMDYVVVVDRVSGAFVLYSAEGVLS